MNNRKHAYEQQLEILNRQFVSYKKKRKRYGLARLISFVAAILLFFILLTINGIWATASAIVLLTIFLVVTLKDINNLKKIQFLEELIRINEDELKSLSGDFSSFDEGACFKEDGHPYIADLDIFGRYGLFQMMNRTTTPQSAQKLADWLKKPSEKEEIIERQEAIQELAKESEWRQQMQAIGRSKDIRQTDFSQLSEWAASRPDSENIRKWNILTTLALIMTAAFVFLASLHFFSWEVLWISLIVHSWIIWRAGKVIAPHYNLLSKTVASLDALEQRLFLISTKDFNAPVLIELQESLEVSSGTHNLKSYQAIKYLKKILGRLDIRFNPLVHFPLNLIFFWDWHQYRSLCRMHIKIHKKILRWMDVFVEIEALNALANLSYNNPEWVFPVIEDEFFMLQAKQLGHPLISKQKRICNDVQLEGVGKMMLVTGSNMAGKSTFLRTVGVNIVLAMTGAPVCADEMIVSPVEVISSMRIADNLEENISTFYAELQKLEYIIKKAKSGERSLLLMDEILRGTNSNDRHAGSRALIEQLLKVNAVGILATHDLALTDMADLYPGQVENYHFDVQIQQEELFFDYALKKGVCTSMNASLLMRKIGIEV